MREYDSTPRPEIENHYHIRMLIEGQEKRSDDRNYHRNKEKERDERDDLIKDSKLVCLTDFYCDKCREDFKGQSIRQVEQDWSCPTQRIAFYKSKCKKGHWVIRLITDRHRDGFFIKSKLMALDRGMHYADTIQPWETNFNLLYGRKNK